MQGVFTRALTDWMAERLSAGHGDISGGGGYLTSWLYNDATQGQVLLVTSIDSINAVHNDTQMFFAQGARGSKVTSCFACTLGRPTPPGSIYVSSEASFSRAQSFLVAGNGAQSASLHADWPLCAILPGWGLGVSSSNTGNTICANFRYVWVTASEWKYFTGQ